MSNCFPNFQPILPLVYDDSLSYYEQLGKISQKVNELINSLVYNGLDYKGEMTVFGADPEPGYWSVDVPYSSVSPRDDGFPGGFEGPGTLFILQGSDETFQATLIGSTQTYTRIYSDNTWASEWDYPGDYELVFRGYTNIFQTIPYHTSGVWAIRKDSESFDLPGDEAGVWNFGTVIIVKNNGYYLATLTTSNGHTFTRYHGGTGDYAYHWSDWRSDFGFLYDITSEVMTGSDIVVGDHGYLRYRQMGTQVFLDVDLDTVPAPGDVEPIPINSILNYQIPHHPNVAIQIPFIANAGTIIGTCRVGVTGVLSVERAFDLDTGTKIDSGFIRYFHIHTTYNIKTS